MTTSVISVGPDLGIHELAKLLLDKGISGVPVVDASGKPIGMVSESDLIGRGDSDQEARRDRWLRLLAEGELLNPEFLASLHDPDRRAGDIMASPIVSVSEEAEVSEIAVVDHSSHKAGPRLARGAGGSHRQSRRLASGDCREYPDAFS
jgi:CBS domain-containing protein